MYLVNVVVHVDDERLRKQEDSTKIHFCNNGWSIFKMLNPRTRLVFG